MHKPSQENQAQQQATKNVLQPRLHQKDLSKNEVRESEQVDYVQIVKTATCLQATFVQSEPRKIHQTKKNPRFLTREFV